MAGHNKWSKVKRLKGALDAKRDQLFSKLAKEITLATRTGGGSPDALYAVSEGLKRKSFEPDSMKLTFIADNHVHLTDEQAASQFLRLTDALEDHDDIQNIHANAEIAEAILSKIGG